MDVEPAKRQIFDTPLSVQRYEWVKEYLVANPHIKSVTDFGCGNGRILLWLKNAPDLESINFVDNDISLLEHEVDYNFRPMFCETLRGRDSSKKDLQIRVYHANVNVPDDRLRADCITMVEVIEHMPLSEVDNVTRVLFGYYQPGSVIITTPNSEFNHLLEEVAGPRATKFRHYDHKFEWTRTEFAHWAQRVCTVYPYSFQMTGVGHLPPKSEPHGPCTQIAIFTRHNNCISSQNTADTNVESNCVDLLLNKLNVRDGVPDWRIDASQKRVSLMADYIIPGSKMDQSMSCGSDGQPFDWSSALMNVEQQAAPIE